MIISINEITFSSFCALYIVSWFQKLKNGQSLDGAVQVSKMATNRSATWCQCVQLARLKFQKYFNHKVQKWVNFYALSIIHDTLDICCKSWTWFILSIWFVLDQLLFFFFYFHQAKHLLHIFPLDTKMQDGCKQKINGLIYLIHWNGIMSFDNIILLIRIQH